MNQKLALFAAGVSTAIVVALAIALTTSAMFNATPSQGASSQELSVAQPPGEPSSIPSPDLQQEALATLAKERELTLQSQIVQGQEALATLDKTMQAQIETLQNQLVDLDTPAAKKAQSTQSLQLEIEALQEAIAQDDLVFQNEIISHQASFGETDKALRLQLQTTLADLELAYAEIASQQTAVQGSDNDQSSHHDGEHEEHDDDEHDEHDEHEEHDDDEHDEHDDDEHEEDGD